MIISLIAAMDKKGGIGKNNRLPWRISSDLARFKKITLGHHVVMGRKTFETIGKPLPGRTTIIMTRNPGYVQKDCIVVHSLKEAVKVADDQHETELFIIGGGEIFSQGIRLADKIYLTAVNGEVDADVFFPRIGQLDWELVCSEMVDPDQRDEYPSEFMIYARKRGVRG